jgi:GrpB-like predicted nucleotidyltransferase (UPF0157 family)
MMSNRPVVLVDYDPEWINIFAQLKVAIEKPLGDLVLSMEHIGSTSVPGLAAKPIIDLVIVIRSYQDLQAVIAKLSDLGYFYQGDKGIPQREAFGRHDDMVPWDGSGRHWMEHHLYVCPVDSVELTRQITFRDHLQAHTDDLLRYDYLKRSLAVSFRNDREAYTNGKSDFIEEILTRYT